MYSKSRRLILSCSFLLLCIASNLAEVTFHGNNLYAVPFNDRAPGYIKRSYLAFAGPGSHASTNLSLTCGLPSNGESKSISIYKGPWSNPTKIVENGVFVAMDPNLSFVVKTESYDINFGSITKDVAGTYYCFLSDNEPMDAIMTAETTSSFAEVIIQDTPTLFCVMHSHTDSVILANTTTPTPIQCLTHFDDLRSLGPDDPAVRVELIDPSANIVQSTLAPLASFRSGLQIFYDLGEIVYDIKHDDSVVRRNNTIVSCTLTSSGATNLCENIEPLSVHSELEVNILPAEANLTAGDSVDLMCMAIPKVVGTVVWSVSGKNNATASLSAFQSISGSKVTLGDFILTGPVAFFNVTCSVDVKGRQRTQASSLVEVHSLGYKASFSPVLVCMSLLLVTISV